MSARSLKVPKRHIARTSFGYTQYLVITPQGKLAMTKLARLFHNADEVVDAWRDALRHRDVQGALDIWLDDELLNALVAYDALQYQVHLHAIGDAAVKQALDALEAMQRINPPWDRRPVIVHAQLVRDEDLSRFAQLGVIANIQPLWCYLDPMNKELIAPRIGHERNNQQYRLRSMVKAGAMIAFGSDWPVTNHVPMQAIGVPVTRSNPADGVTQAWVIEQALTMDESLTFYTKNAAYQLFRENEFGALEVGRRAAFLVLDSDPALNPAAKLVKLVS